MLGGVKQLLSRGVSETFKIFYADSNAYGNDGNFENQ